MIKAFKVKEILDPLYISPNNMKKDEVIPKLFELVFRAHNRTSG
jgi:hypothetical protein